MKRKTNYLAVAALSLFCFTQTAGAQWLTQTLNLKAGWNAVYLHVNASHATLNELVGADDDNPIEEIWLWESPVSAQQFAESPQLPTSGGTQWASWVRNLGPSSALQRLIPNAAYLVRVSSDVPTYNWNLKGKPVPPRYHWTTTGLNFLGFPTREATPSNFEDFMNGSPELLQNAQVYRYLGGDLGDTNPARLFAFRTASVNRGEAYWIRSGTFFNRYFGPFDLDLQNPSGVHYGDSLGQYRIRLKNAVNSPMTVNLNFLPSETAPSGEPTISGLAPILLRGPLNLTNLTHGYTPLSSGQQSWTLAPKGQPDSEVEIILGLNRWDMAGAAGSLYAGILRFTDSAGLSQLDIPVSGVVASKAGLWVGNAQVNYVSHYLKNFAKATNANDFTNVLTRLQLTNGLDGFEYGWDQTSGRILVYGGPENKSGSYLLDGPIREDAGTVARRMPLRLIVHHDGTNTTRLLQQVYIGLGAANTNIALTTRENLLLPSELELARRITAVHLPFSPGGVPWNMSGAFQQGSSVNTIVDLAHDNTSVNPFLHTYHPDHDNLDALFQQAEPQGAESFHVTRQITLNFTPPADNFSSLTTGSQLMSGDYQEQLTFAGRPGHSKQFHTLGTFSLNRISDVSLLQQ